MHSRLIPGSGGISRWAALALLWVAFGLVLLAGPRPASAATPAASQPPAALVSGKLQKRLNNRINEVKYATKAFVATYETSNVQFKDAIDACLSAQHAEINHDPGAAAAWKATEQLAEVYQGVAGNAIAKAVVGVGSRSEDLWEDFKDKLSDRRVELLREGTDTVTNGYQLVSDFELKGWFVPLQRVKEHKCLEALDAHDPWIKRADRAILKMHMGNDVLAKLKR